MKIPSEVPLIALPRCILFPQAMLPLHIFEERYRQMLKDSLSSHRMFCVGTLRQEQKAHKEYQCGLLILYALRIVTSHQRLRPDCLQIHLRFLC